MASHGYLPAIVFHPEQGLNRVPKDVQRLLPNPELRQDAVRSGPLGMRPHQDDEPWKPRSRLFESHEFVNIDPTVTRPLLIDVQGTRPRSTLFSFDIAKPVPKHDEIVKFLMSRSSEIERDGLDWSQLLHALDCKPSFPVVACSESRFVYPDVELYPPKPLVDFMGDLVRRSEVKFHEDGRVSLAGTGTEMKDLLSILAEFYLSRNSTDRRKHSTLVPQFNWLNYGETSCYGSSLGLETMTFAPPKSPEKVKPKSFPRKRTTRNKPIKDQHRTTYVQACESLLSIVVDKNRNVKSAIPVLKRSGPELSSLLTQFSAVIAGTGLAVLLSVVCKLASGRAPSCTPKLLNTGLGLGLVWLSWAVNGLRDTVVNMSKKSNKKGGNEEEMIKKLDESVKEIYFRAAALMAVVVLRLA